MYPPQWFLRVRAGRVPAACVRLVIELNAMALLSSVNATVLGISCAFGCSISTEDVEGRFYKED